MDRSAVDGFSEGAAVVCLLRSLVVVAALVAAVARAEEPPKVARVVVPRMQVSNLDQGSAELLTDVLLDVLLNRHGIQAIGPSAIQQLLGIEAQRQLIGCDASDCFAEIGGALDARYLLSGRIGKLGKRLVLTLLLVDTEEAELAGRATVTLSSIEDAVDAIGPLTDKLLGRTFRAARASEIAAFRKREDVRPDYEPLSPRAFCKRCDRYREALEKRPYDPGHPKTREQLLYDLILTPFKPRYDDKLRCAKASIAYTVPRVRGLLQMSDDEATAEDCRARIAEARAFSSELEVVEDAYAMGLEKVKLNTGTLPTGLPFEVRPAEILRPEESEQVRAYRKLYDEGQAVVKRALAAIRAGRVKRLEKLFAGEPEKAAKNARQLTDSVRKAEENGYRYDPCPAFVPSVDQIEAWAAELAKKGTLTACVRKRSETSAYLREVHLEKVKGRWRITRW